jgi:hypothetical protein
LTALTASIFLCGNPFSISACLQFFSELKHLKSISSEIHLEFDPAEERAVAWERLQRFYKELFFCLLKNCQKLKIVSVYAFGVYPTTLMKPELRLQTDEYLEFLQLICNVQHLDKFAINGDVSTFCEAFARNGNGVVTNLKSLMLSGTLERAEDLRLALLKLCPNVERLDLCVDVLRLDLATLEGDRLSNITLADVINFQVSDIDQ